MKRWCFGVVVAANLMWPRPAAADVTVTIADGHVSISAANATVRQILTEWARVGQTRIVNLDRVKEVKPAMRGEYLIVLKNGKELSLTRGVREIQQRLEFL